MEGKAEMSGDVLGAWRDVSVGVDVNDCVARLCEITTALQIMACISSGCPAMSLRIHTVKTRTRVKGEYKSNPYVKNSKN